MKLETAYNKLTNYYDEMQIRDYVPVSDGYVFYIYGVTQPVFVDTHSVRGLNGNRKEDISIINEAAKIYKKEE